MDNKKKYGQFYTTNCDYILEGIQIPEGAKLIEPFVGQGDLIRWSGRDDWETYDIDPKNSAETRDTLLNAPNYKDKFVITNPPFLARNKSEDKRVYEKYSVRDLYKASIKSFVDGDVAGGILIVPFNFFCDTDDHMRDLFFSKYSIKKVRVFEEAVFDDTDVSVCAFMFNRSEFDEKIEFTFLPSNFKATYELKKSYGFKIAGHVFQKNKKSKIKWGRLLAGQVPNTSLYLRAIDTGSESGRIKMFVGSSCTRKKEIQDSAMEYVQKKFRGMLSSVIIEASDYFYDETKKSSERSFATITCNHKIEDEELVARLFNNEIERLREEYRSVFLTNFRNSTSSYARKRISFDQAYTILDKIINNLLDKQT
jgi:hypothetical protein